MRPRGWIVGFMCALLNVQGVIRPAAGQSAGFGGQAIGFTTVNPATPFQMQAGLRYIPELSLSVPLGDYSLEGEFSANLWGSGTWQPGDSLYLDSELSPYRLWMRFSGDQLEIRAGLQKINFGSAVLFRPLMWFDRIDPRDPLQLTDGVYGLLGRYYFLNNMNIWLWGIYGNGQTKGWEIFPSKKNTIEYGGRYQVPLFTGEVAATYHHRTVDPSGVIPDSLGNGDPFPENRVALDAKFDLGVGFWVEGALIHQQAGFTDLKYRSLLNAGLDYTFNLGNGLGVMTEFFGFLQGQNPLGSEQHMTFGLLSVTYPLNIIHDLGAMVFYNFSDNSLYRFVNWSITFDRWSFYIMGFWNPDSYQLYNLDFGSSLYGGTGFQLMVVFNH
jgi:hypothetical protein